METMKAINFLMMKMVMIMNMMTKMKMIMIMMIMIKMSGFLYVFCYLSINLRFLAFRILLSCLLRENSGHTFFPNQIKGQVILSSFIIFDIPNFQRN